MLFEQGSRQDLSDRHAAEWRWWRIAIFEPCQDQEDSKQAREAKSIADILKIYQEGERKAYLAVCGDDGQLAVRDSQLSGWRSFYEQSIAPMLEDCAACDLAYIRACADCLKVSQEAERKAYGFGGEEALDDEVISADFQD